MATVRFDDPKVRIKLGAAAALLVIALLVVLRGTVFGSASEPVDAAAVEAGNALVADMQAQRVPPPGPARDEVMIEPGSGQRAQPTR